MKNDVLFKAVEENLQQLKMDQQSRQIRLDPPQDSFEGSVDFVCAFVTQLPPHFWKLDAPAPDGLVVCTRDELAQRLPQFIKDMLGEGGDVRLFEMIEKEIPGELRYTYSTQSLYVANQHQIAMFTSQEVAKGTLS